MKSDERVIIFAVSICVMIAVIVVGSMTFFLVTNLCERYENREVAINYLPAVEVH